MCHRGVCDKVGFQHRCSPRESARVPLVLWGSNPGIPWHGARADADKIVEVVLVARIAYPLRRQGDRD